VSDKIDLRFGSNDVRLAPAEWGVALAIVLGFIALAPIVWPFVEPLRVEPDYRLPYFQGNDYYTYARLCRAAAARGSTFVVGDSMVWGHYVAEGQTLSAHLNRLAGGQRFANLGVDGIHPAAMLGLLKHHGRAIRNRNVVLHCNLLWMSSPRHDLSTEKEFPFNHPTLVPQFSPRIPCYRQPFGERLGIVIERSLPFHAWKKHVQIACFGGSDIASWTLDHPYECPVSTAAQRLREPSGERAPSVVAEPWTRRGIARQSFAWVELDKSLQWRFFRDTVALLRRRGNRIFVLVGPFNEHMLTEGNRAVYAARKRAVGVWLEANGIPHLVAPVLPSRLYADASHPLAEGYGLLAKQLFDCQAFITFDRSKP